MRTIFSKSSKDVFHNTRVKSYLDGSYKVSCANSPVYKEPGWEAPLKEFVPKPKDMENETRSDSMSRAKNKFVDICRLNEWYFYFTFTFNPKVVNSFDTDEVKRIVRNYFSNLVQRKNAIYALVPETHKSGRIHIHGFLRADNLKLEYSGNVKVKGHKQPIKEETAKRFKIPPSEWVYVYNVPSWDKYGFSTVYLLDTSSDIANMSKYVIKYITKENQMIFGNYYLAGGKDLERNAPTDLCDIDFNSFEAQSEYENLYSGVKYKTFDSSSFKPELTANDIFEVVDDDGFFDLV